MSSAGVRSFLVGLPATTALVLTGLAAYPYSVDGETPVEDVWLWKGGAVKRVRLGVPSTEPRLEHADDGSLYATSSAIEGAQRFDAAAQSFTAPSKMPEHAASPPSPEGVRGGSLASGSAGLWVENRLAGDRRRTFFRRDGTWSPGPELTTAQDNVSAMSLDGGRVAVFTSSMDGPELFVASEHDAVFHPVALVGKTWAGLTAVGGVAGEDTRLLVVTWNHDPRVATYVIDVDSGKVTEGPRLEAPRRASSIWRVSGEWVPGGGLMVVGNGNLHGLDHPLQNCAGAVLLLLELAGLVWGLAKGRLTPGYLILGLAAGLLPLALLGIWVISHTKHLW